jgi:Uma2 family endonuclease
MFEMVQPVATAMRLTTEEFLTYADAHPRQRFELLGGEPVAMAPSTIRHDIIAGNLDAVLRRQVHSRGCRSHRDAGLSSGADGDFFPQPDLTVRCGPVDGKARWISDPLVVVEVLSPSTMSEDRGYKLKTYQASFQTLRHIVLIYQGEVRVEHWFRGANGIWSEGPQVLSSCRDTLSLEAVGALVPLSELYEDVTLG